jgi:hypothetical protein
MAKPQEVEDALEGPEMHIKGYIGKSADFKEPFGFVEQFPASGRPGRESFSE